MLKETNTPTRPRIEPGSPDPESDALTIREIGLKRGKDRREEGIRRKVERNGLSEGREVSEFNKMGAGKEYGERDWQKEK